MTTLYKRLAFMRSSDIIESSQNIALTYKIC